MEAYTNNNQSIRVWSPAGLFCLVQARAKVDASPDEVFNILTEPMNYKIFRNCVPASKLERRVSKEGDVVVVEQAQKGRWKFLMLSGSFMVNIRTEMDRKRGIIRFNLSSPGFMKMFEGEWTLMPFNQASMTRARALESRHRVDVKSQREEQKRVDKMNKKKKQREDKSPSTTDDGPSRRRFLTHLPRPNWPPFDLSGQLLPSLPSALAHITAKGGFAWQQEPEASLVLLRQSVQPALSPPPPIDKWVRRITAKVAAEVLEDLQAEAIRRRNKDFSNCSRRGPKQAPPGLEPLA
jgi:ribosome-associated toxin RatA of RatAB toxin-antitoxin module